MCFRRSVLGHLRQSRCPHIGILELSQHVRVALSTILNPLPHHWVWIEKKSSTTSCQSIHFPNPLSTVAVLQGSAGANPSTHNVKAGNIPWTGRQSIASLSLLSLLPPNQVMRKDDAFLNYPGKYLMQTWKKHKFHRERPLAHVEQSKMFSFIIASKGRLLMDYTVSNCAPSDRIIINWLLPCCPTFEKTKQNNKSSAY